jgi:pimeloyl-ACP methyl ester carboxylesterase
MSNPSSVLSHESWSEVRASDHVIRYRRCGAGRTVLVLHHDQPDHRDGWSYAALLEALGGRFRLLMPELPGGAMDVATRVALFLDGLGVADVAVLAFGDLCLPALELALLGGDQVARLALVTEGQAEVPDLDGALVTASGQALPLVLIRDAGRGGDDAAVLVRFLGDGPPEGPLARP